MPTYARKLINRNVEEFSRICNGKILYVGVNYQWHEHYKSLFREFVAIDIKPDTVIPPDMVADIQECPEIASSSYDGAIVTGVWELLQYPESAAGEIRRILKKGGWMLAGFPGIGFGLNGFTLPMIVELLDQFLVEKIEVVYYKSERPFYIDVICRK